MKGTVIKYFKDKGYGFIACPNMKNAFFHISDLNEPQSLEVGSMVEFELTFNSRGAKAIKIVLLKGYGGFVNFGNIKLKFSKIKNFSISENDFFSYEINTFKFEKTHPKLFGLFTTTVYSFSKSGTLKYTSSNGMYSTTDDVSNLGVPNVVTIDFSPDSSWNKHYKYIVLESSKNMRGCE